MSTTYYRIDIVFLRDNWREIRVLGRHVTLRDAEERMALLASRKKGNARYRIVEVTEKVQLVIGEGAA